MKRIASLLLTLSLAAIAVAQTVSQTILIDYGENNVSGRGNLTSKADTRGNWWSNVYSPGNHNHLYPQSFPLVDTKNEATGKTVEIGSFFNTNGMTGGGGLTSPLYSQLKELAVATATQDYIFVETYLDYNVIRFKGLRLDCGYRFTTLGSRQTEDERTGILEFRGVNAWHGTLQMSGKAIGYSKYNGNNNNPLVSDVVFPDSMGCITLTVCKKFKNGMVYINCMKVEELEGMERPDKDLHASQRFLVDFGEVSNAQRGHTTTKDSYGHRWNNLNPSSSTDHTIPAGKKVRLYNDAGKVTMCYISTLSAIPTNGIDAGGLNAPSEDALGDLAVKTATEDYIYTNDDNVREIKLTGLDTQKCYRFRLLGHRATSDSDRRSSWYQVSGQTDWQTVQLNSGNHVGGEGIHGNVANISASDYIYPALDGSITFRMKRNSEMGSQFAYLNVMEVTEYEGGTRPEEPLVLSKAWLSGSGTEDGQDVPMQEIKPAGMPTGIFEAYMKAPVGEYVLKGITQQGDTVCFGQGSDAQQLAQGGEPFTNKVLQVLRVRVNIKEESISAVPVELYVKGNIVNSGVKVAYEGHGVWRSEVNLSNTSVFLFSDKYFYFAFNNDDALAVKRLRGSRTQMGMPSEGYSTENIRMNAGRYTLCLDMNSMTWDVDAPIDEYRISAFGSSVCNGQGADGNKGYAYMYGEQLAQRTKSGLSSSPFKVSGVAIGGNTTNDLLNRYDEMLHDFGRYVIIGLSMGNEGIHGASDQNAIFNQFSNNLLKIVNKCKADGKVPVVMNNYTRSDYNASDYSYIKKMNLTIHKWACASVNVLGAIDNGAGQWADGYVADTYHQNTEGHREFMYAIPPSLFDALEADKPQPVRNSKQYMKLPYGETLQFKGEGTVHPFTVTVRMKGRDAGRIISFKSGSKQGIVSILSDGKVEYVSPSGTTITSSKALITSLTTAYNVSITHYYAQQRTLVYVNSTLVGEVKERLVPTLFAVGDETQDIERQYSEVFFWRSAMTADEFSALGSSAMLKSSLEIYAPLSEDMKATGFDNLAQSMNATLSLVENEEITAVGSIPAQQTDGQEEYFTLGGVKLGSPRPGVNVVRSRSGKTEKRIY